MSPDILAEIQRRGWVIDLVEPDTVTVRCPQPGCEVRTRFNSTAKIPDACMRLPHGATIIESVDHGRKMLKDRRQLLGLTIEDMEEIIGCAPSHYAKVERDSYNDAGVSTRRSFNLEMFLDSAEGLGLRLAILPGPMPRKTLSIMCQTRDRLAARWRAAGVVMVPSKPANDS